MARLVANPKSPARKFIDDRFTLQPLSRNVNKELRSLPLPRRPYDDTYSYAVAGTSADLMIRSLFDQALHKNWTVAMGLSTLGDGGYSFGNGEGGEQLSTWGNGKHFFDKTPGPETKTTEIIREFEIFSTTHDFRDIDDTTARRLAAYCIMFGRIDHARRSFRFYELMPFGPLALEEKLERMSTAAMIDDLLGLFREFSRRHPATISTASRVVTGGVLAGSRDAQGADFDFVVDGCLYEIKTTIKPAMSTGMLRQCIGYWLLDYEDDYEISEIALDLPRQDFVIRLDVRRDLLSTRFSDVSTAEIRAAFRDLLRSMSRDEFGHLMV